MWKKDMSPEEAAQIIERFLAGHSLYPQEWNDFVETPQHNSRVEGYRMRCYQLDPLVNRPGDQDAASVAELESIIGMLRSEKHDS
jgi:hypothetical protein